MRVTVISPGPDITPVSLSDLSDVTCAFSRCILPSSHADCLIVAFDGEAGNSHEHCGAFAYMRAMIAAAIAAWDPSALVLDLTWLKYDWGDEMGRVLGTIGLPTTVVVSMLNREGLTSLVQDELFAEPRDWLFDSLSGAIAACDRRYIAGH